MYSKRTYPKDGLSGITNLHTDALTHTMIATTAWIRITVPGIPVLTTTGVTVTVVTMVVTAVIMAATGVTGVTTATTTLRPKSGLQPDGEELLSFGVRPGHRID